MLTMKIKDFFFDRERVEAAAGRAKIRVLSKIGAFVRRRAQTSMRKRKGPSAPGQPPHAHRNPLLRKLLFFGYDPSTDSVVVGPVRARRGEAPPLNEFGGSVNRRGRVATYPKRPFMAPALKAEEPKLPDFWSGTIRGDT